MKQQHYLAGALGIKYDKSIDLLLSYVTGKDVNYYTESERVHRHTLARYY